ncbi:MAG TPA: hypothetical protein VIA07_05490, partial [Desulfuromonadales bacterium]
ASAGSGRGSPALFPEWQIFSHIFKTFCFYIFDKFAKDHPIGKKRIRRPVNSCRQVIAESGPIPFIKEMS